MGWAVRVLFWGTGGVFMRVVLGVMSYLQITVILLLTACLIRYTFSRSCYQCVQLYVTAELFATSSVTVAN